MGIWDVDGLLEAMTSRQLAEWNLYFGLEPFGDEVLDTHLATITAILSNAYRGKGETAKPVEKFKLWKSIRKAFNAETFYQNLRSWAVLAGARKKDE